MKKWIALGLMSALSFLTIGCGNTNSSTNINTNNETEQETVEKNNDYFSEEDNEVFTEVESSEVFIEPFNESPTIKEKILWDEQDVKVIATSLGYDIGVGKSELLLNVTLENNSDQNLVFKSGSGSQGWSSINGYSFSGYLFENVEPGETVESHISYAINDIRSCGINEIASIELTIEIIDENLNSIILPEQKIETDIANSYNFEEDTYQAILENGKFEQIEDCIIQYLSYDAWHASNGISLISEMLASPKDPDEEFSGNYLNLYLEMENNSDHNVYAVISNIYVNGVSMTDSNWTNTCLFPGSKGIMHFDLIDILYLSDEDIDIETFYDEGLDSVTFTLSMKDEDYVDVFTPQEITFNF